ncbi:MULTISPECIES: AraC family transcriptional regulator [Vibrio]|uniref:AraC family transcriptional regulator n=2 Tax=Vibrio genomosp. F10 TaxID=723171 RepID=A0A1B9QZA0_9VIBR|nr:MULTISPECIES: helix-turn-helix transcriptional regulator [Vibrio]OCH76500.1 AraC family transcriptional regulator [Vibrio genomosp. F10]OEE37461.1 AraC family transcriptional regulator [Vibrio genomosp. F10 str. ZF-129]OEE92941.1 AraC family transcriptional regulator [Vibrio genomosp. F10 str. 9ZC157]OEE93196.1 AraC family transcriptional regulator [Vibrio genomosp. F10 str. 9ZD137]OEF07488.1 AraC family transcriptional regulator [Vibrio genomosp. F10 str. 9ZB36]
MKKTARILHQSLSIVRAPSDVFMNFEAFLSNTETRVHSHPWGQVQLISGGILEMEAEGTRFLAPPHLAIWVPAGAEHCSYNRKPLEYCSLNVAHELTDGFPKSTSLIKVTPIVSSIIDDFRQRSVNVAESEQDKRLIQVLLDQLATEETERHFLPTSTNKYLSTILDSVEHNPTDTTSLGQWAERVHTTERTLARHCQSELGMSFTEWRLRVRYLYSMDLLRKGHSVKEVALTLGYNQASPYISMFKKYSGQTPEQYKNRLLAL